MKLSRAFCAGLIEAGLIALLFGRPTDVIPCVLRGPH